MWKLVIIAMFEQNAASKLSNTCTPGERGGGGGGYRFTWGGGVPVYQEGVGVPVYPERERQGWGR